MISNNLLREKVLQKLLVDDFFNEDNTLLSSVCVLDNLKKISGKKLPYLDVKFLRGQSEGTYKEDGFEVNTGDLVILVDGENSGEIFEIPCQGYMGSTFKKLKLSDEVIRKYIMYFIALNKELLKGNKTGSAIPHLNKKLFASLKLHVPNKELQSEIVDKIDSIFELIDKKEKNDQEKTRFKKILKDNVLDSAIHGTLENNDSSLLPIEVDGIKNDIPFEIPNNWKWVTFNKIANIVRGGSPRPIKDYLTDSPDGINWIKIGDTNPNDIYINNVKEKIKPEGMKKSRFVEKGSLLLTNSMSFGRPYILNVDGCIHDGWLNIKDNNKNFYNMYMVYLLSSKYFYNVMCDKSSGAVVSNLNIDKVKSMLIPLPPLEEQRRIVEKIENIFELIEQL